MEKQDQYIANRISYKDSSFNVPVAYLKALIILLVILSHTVVYHSIYAPEKPYTSLTDNWSWIIIPIVDGNRSFFLTLLQQFNTGFIMALMYFLSGLFVWKSLQKKGRLIYLRDRLKRLGIPLLAMAFITPITYIPVHMQVEGKIGLFGYWLGIFTQGRFITGPGWFISMLLLFNVIVVLFSLIPRKNKLSEKKHEYMEKPVRFFLWLLLISAIVNVPMAMVSPGLQIIAFGPFAVQANRMYLYLFYFIAGVYIGAYGIDRTFLTNVKKFLSKWYFWTMVMGILYAFRMYISFAKTDMPHTVQVPAYIFGNFTYALLCAVSSLAFLAIFLRFVTGRRKALDSFYNNSYGLYIIHFPVICWLELSLFSTGLPPIPKDLIVLVGTALLGWGFIALVRKIPGVKHVI